MERLIVERKLFHRACFRCSKCSACLRPGTYHYFPETDKFCCLFDCAGGNYTVLTLILNLLKEKNKNNN